MSAANQETCSSSMSLTWMFMRMFIMTSLVMKVSRCVTSLQPSSVSCRHQQQHNGCASAQAQTSQTGSPYTAPASV